jgi:hypothetical protein
VCVESCSEGEMYSVVEVVVQNQASTPRRITQGCKSGFVQPCGQKVIQYCTFQQRKSYSI